MTMFNMSLSSGLCGDPKNLTIFAAMNLTTLT